MVPCSVLSCWPLLDEDWRRCCLECSCPKYWSWFVVMFWCDTCRSSAIILGCFDSNVQCYFHYTDEVSLPSSESSGFLCQRDELSMTRSIQENWTSWIQQYMVVFQGSPPVHLVSTHFYSSKTLKGGWAFVCLTDQVKFSSPMSDVFGPIETCYCDMGVPVRCSMKEETSFLVWHVPDFVSWIGRGTGRTIGNEYSDH